MSALSHPRRGRLAQAYRARSCLRGRGCDDLQDVVPVEMHVGVFGLHAVVRPRVDDEAIVRVNVITTARKPPRFRSSSSPSAIVVVSVMLTLRIVMWTRWQSEVHEMRNAMTFPTVLIHVEQLSFILIQRLKLLPGLVFGFAILDVARRGAASVSATAATTNPAAAAVVGEELLSRRLGRGGDP